MARFVLRLACAMLFVAVANAFSASPMKGSRIAARSVIAQSAPTMSLEVSTSQVAQMSTSLLAVAKETDFGGYTGPAVGLVLVAVLISVLTNPYDDLAGKK
mmetsp:Transcript_17231/g.44155  ORF Transcript_17231/g.44155 Transcript_17231/m.44155 type:complete len:101 (-) Transcript_17231:327-629(-)